MLNYERDAEFAKVFVEMLPKLDKFFHFRLKNAGRSGTADWALMKDDLIQQTAYKALQYSRTPNGANYLLRKLIRIKAGNTWSEYIRQSKTKPFKHTPENASQKESKDPDPFKTMVNKEMPGHLPAKAGKVDLKIILQMIAEGYHYSEIAERFKINEGAVKMQVHRLKKWLNRKGKK